MRRLVDCCGSAGLDLGAGTGAGPMCVFGPRIGSNYDPIGGFCRGLWRRRGRVGGRVSRSEALRGETRRELVLEVGGAQLFSNLVELRSILPSAALVGVWGEGNRLGGLVGDGYRQISPLG